MAMKRKFTYLVILGTTLLLLFGSCGEEGAGPECINCQYWRSISSGSVRFPDVSPSDWHLIAFSSKRHAGRDTVVLPTRNYHIWVMKLAESPGDTNRYYQITKDAITDRYTYNDLKPSWSPDGKWIAFQREISPARYQIYAVDVRDLEKPGIPFQVTNIDYSNTDPCWVTIGDTLYIAFTNSPLGGGDHDIMIARFDPSGAIYDPYRLTVDPSDYADEEGGVLSATFHDWQTSSNRSNSLAFSSDSRTRVADIKIEARLEDGTEVNAAIAIKGKDSGKTTPYTFRYRPVDQPIELRCVLSSDYYILGYCDPLDTTVTSLVPDTLNLIDVKFIPTKGALKVVQLVSRELTYDVYLDSERVIKGLGYGYDRARTLICLAPGKHVVELRFAVAGGDSLIDIDTNVVIVAGEVREKVFGGSLEASPMKRLELSNPDGSDKQPLKKQSKGPSSLGKYTIWKIDLGSVSSVNDDVISLIDDSSVPIQNPVITSDGRFIAYLKGYGYNCSVMVADLWDIANGNIRKWTVGLPGTSGDFECWRLVESLAWIETGSGLKLLATLSPCGGGDVDSYGIWIADVDQLIR